LAYYNLFEDTGTDMDSTSQITVELQMAETARASGNEGRARVCARRAAGIAARDFLARRGVGVRNASAFEVLKVLAETPGLDPDLRRSALHLTLRVTEAFELPVDADLIADARSLCAGLADP
jgi:hypothetical protein